MKKLLSAITSLPYMLHKSTPSDPNSSQAIKARKKKSNRAIVVFLIPAMTAASLLLTGISPAQAGVVAPQSWTSSGLNEVARYVGKFQVSTDGYQNGPSTNTTFTANGTLSILKPSGATNVVAAFLSSGSPMRNGLGAPTPPTTNLNSQNVVYGYSSIVTNRFANYLSDVTSIVQSYMDSNPSGSGASAPFAGTRFEIPVTYDASRISSGTNTGDPIYSSGVTLTVIFENPTLANESTSLVLFGQAGASQTYQQTQFTFPAIASNAIGSYLSLAIAWSTGSGSEVSEVRVSNESVPTNFTQVSSTAGGTNDSAGNSGGYLTFGGVGDSTLNTGSPDDELYNLDAQLTVGTEKVTLETRNNSGDDNFFQAVLSLPFSVNAAAGTYSVTYDEQGGSAVADDSFTAGGSVTLPSAPTRTGFTFSGWYTAASGGNLVQGPSYSPGVTAPVSLFARWQPLSYTVTYNTHGGSSVANGTYATGNTISLPAAPTRSGFTFAGWFTSSTGGSPLGSTYSPLGTGNITLHAQWTSNTSVAIQPAATTVALARTGSQMAELIGVFGITTVAGLLLLAQSIRLRRRGTQL